MEWQPRIESSTVSVGSPAHLTVTTSGRTALADPDLWGANGNVLDIARAGNTLYIAGSFRSVGDNIGGFAPTKAQTGELLRPFPKVAGSVGAMVPDGSGGWYIGGEFSAVGGKPRSCLAQIRADGSVTDWNPNVSGSPGYIDPPAVIALALHGNRLFVGGAFREIDGQPHENFGCVDAQTGTAIDCNLDVTPEGFVAALLVDRDILFVAGGFSTLAGQPRGSLAALDAVTGNVLPWRADVVGGAYALQARDDTLYVGGDYIAIAGIERHMLAAIDIRTGQLLPFDARASGVYRDYLPQPQVAALALLGDTLFVAGNFTQIGGTARTSLAALDATTGDALSWSPPPVGPQYEGFPPRLCAAIAVSSATVYVGGWFEAIGNESRPFAAALSRQDGALLGWNPEPDLAVGLIVPCGGTVYVGGIFSLMGRWQHRAGLAAIDIGTGSVKAWNPNPDGAICTAVAVTDGHVFVSGDFSTIGSTPQPRRYFAELDTLNGEATGWNPGADETANVLLLEGNTLYAGGEFTQIGGLARDRLAAVDATTGEVTNWNPGANSSVYALAKNGSTIYVGGLFSQIGGLMRRGVGAVSSATGDVMPWNPDTDNSTVYSLLISGDRLYVGGGFGHIGGQPRTSLAALDLTTGAATDWDPGLTQWDVVTPRVWGLAMMDSLICVGGSFASVAGRPRVCLAAVDTSSGLPTDWDPSLNGLVWSLVTDGNTIYVGGGFTRAGGLPASGLASFSSAQEPPSGPLAFGLAQSIPNPAISSAVIRFTLPEATSVTFTVYDVQGRLLATPLDHAVQQAGLHEVRVQADRWKSGVYLYRLVAGGRSASGKMVVIR